MSKIITEVRSRVFVITINRPEVRNAVDGETAELFDEAWTRFRDDDDLWVAVLTGAGDKAFSAGADLGALDTLGPGFDATPNRLRHFASHGRGYLGYSRQTDIYKPILIALNGDALAGGLELACLGDMRIAEEHVRLGVACRRWNVPLCDGGTQRLPRIIGMGHAMDMILTGRFVDADEAMRMGLVNRIVPRGEALSATLELAETLCQLPQGAMRTDKQAAVMGFGRPLAEGLRIEGELAMWTLSGSDFREGAAAFKARRKPEFEHED